MGAVRICASGEARCASEASRARRADDACTVRVDVLSAPARAQDAFRRARVLRDPLRRDMCALCVISTVVGEMQWCSRRALFSSPESRCRVYLASPQTGLQVWRTRRVSGLTGPSVSDFPPPSNFPFFLRATDLT